MKNKCWRSTCSEEARHRGTMYLAKASKPGWRKKIMRLMCDVHYLENTFGLWPYICTKACVRAQRKATGVKLREEDLIVWVKLGAIIKVAKSFAVARKPKCPWCGKKMKHAS